MLGWHLYAGDYNDNLARSAGLDSLVTAARADKNYTLNQWCMGTMDRWPDMTNAQLIMDSTLFQVWGHWRSISALRIATRAPRQEHALGRRRQTSVRSMSMNCWMNPINAWALTTPKEIRP